MKEMLSTLKYRLVLAILLTSYISTAQQINANLRSLNELIDSGKLGWSLIEEWAANGQNKIEILPVDTNLSKDALFKTQVTTKSPMGAIVYFTGGILIEDGLIRILGSGCRDLRKSLPEWNNGKTFDSYGEQPGYLLVADDAIGGFFALNWSGLGDDQGKMYYLSPDDLKWEALGISYSEFLQFCFSGDLQQFYSGIMTSDLKAKTMKISADEALTFFPALWSEQVKQAKEGVLVTVKDVAEIYKDKISSQQKYLKK